MKCFTMSATKCIILRPFYKLFILYLLKKQHFKSKYQEACFSLRWLVATEVFILYAPFESSQEKKQGLAFQTPNFWKPVDLFWYAYAGTTNWKYPLKRRKNPSFIFYDKSDTDVWLEINGRSIEWLLPRLLQNNFSSLFICEVFSNTLCPRKIDTFLKWLFLCYIHTAS